MPCAWWMSNSLKEESDMMEPSDRSSRTRLCTVVFLDIVEYSKKAVAEQIAMKERLNTGIAQAIEQVSRDDRIILDTGDGAALCFLSDPEEALFAALNLRDTFAAPLSPELIEIDVRIGVNLGPVRVVRDLNQQLNVLGDGINVAQRVMSFAQSNQVLVSRSFYEVISRVSQEYSQLFHYRGLHKDKHIREHEVYEVGLAPPNGTEASTGVVEICEDVMLVHVDAARRPMDEPARTPKWNTEVLATAERQSGALYRAAGQGARAASGAHGHGSSRPLCDVGLRHIRRARAPAIPQDSAAFSLCQYGA